MGTLRKLFLEPINVFRNPVFLFIFLNGFLTALMVYFYVEDNYESQIFKAMASQVKGHEEISEQNQILGGLQLTYNLEKYRQSVFGDKNIHAIKSDIIRPVTFDLMTGSGACGSYSYVLSRLLNEMNFETRFAQMKVGDRYGGHIVIEAKVGDNWVVLDAMYNLYFKNEDGSLASFDQVKNNWQYFQKQVPSNYDLSYNYMDVRYTNWDKIPVLMPAIKGTLDLVLGKADADKVSLRSMFLRKYDFLFKSSLVIYIISTMLFVRLYIKQSKEIEDFRVSLLFAKRTTKAVAARLAF